MIDNDERAVVRLSRETVAKTAVFAQTYNKSSKMKENRKQKEDFIDLMNDLVMLYLKDYGYVKDKREDRLELKSFDEKKEKSVERGIYEHIKCEFDLLFDRDSKEESKNEQRFIYLIHLLFSLRELCIEDIMAIYEQYSEIPVKMLREKKWNEQGVKIKKGAKGVLLPDLPGRTGGLRIYDIRQCEISAAEYPVPDVFDFQDMYRALLVRIDREKVKMHVENDAPVAIEYDDTRNVLTFSKYRKTREEIFGDLARAIVEVNMSKSGTYFVKDIRSAISVCAASLVCEKYKVAWDYEMADGSFASFRDLYRRVTDTYESSRDEWEKKRTNETLVSLDMYFKGICEPVFMILISLREEALSLEDYIISEMKLICETKSDKEEEKEQKEKEHEEDSKEKDTDTEKESDNKCEEDK